MKKQDLRGFRRSVSILKKQGVLPKTVDARKAKPTQKVGRSKLSTWLTKYDDILSGKMTAVKLSPAKLKEYKKNPKYDSVGDRLLVPHAATERVTISKRDGGNFAIENPAGLTRVQIPVAYHNLEQYLDDIAKQTTQIDKLKRKNEWFGFRFFGNNSSRVYRNVDLAIEDISSYNAVVNSTGAKDDREVYRNLEFIRIRKLSDWTFASENQRKQSRERNRVSHQRFLERLKDRPEQLAAYRLKNAEKQRLYRASLKGKAKKKYKKDAKERRKQSDAKRKRKT